MWFGDFNVFLQKGGGAIFNTVKTKANPAMKTVYKFVSTSGFLSKLENDSC